MSDNIRLIGEDELRRKLSNPSWVTGPLGEFFDKWRFATQRQAVANIKRGRGGWLDTGGTRQSITSERDEGTIPQYARVGSNKPTARWGEFGTGLLSEDPEATRKRHWPPSAALEPWARKHGTTGFLVARAIGLRGGLAPRRFLRDAAETTEPKITGWLAQAARDIETEASRGA